ncbi:HD domain-containing phosphohydrolase [Nocardia seriolae]|nr:HD domain-containing phosphohydrolase [Nocardia seriolae]MTJ64876.1 HD domain-containing protein [Nocardia seriolae]MTJ70901.1 HD domain-containing protein [Nocardia seriolae]MTJ89692.1 HD domain-containing protein [Nocardia seriolae]MTK33667.1 HD domain-containing protein [Nocardia seriolae]MTK42819.1 HD domain-containing protein [Nocardia seriolae]
MQVTPTSAEVAALLATMQDHALGQPPGCQLRATVLAGRLARAAGCSDEDCETVWWTSALRFLGCTGHAFDMAVVFGDEIEMRARTARLDFSDPLVVVRAMVESAGRDRHGLDRFRSMLSILAGGRKAAELNFRTACEVADTLAKRLGLGEPVQAALRASFERWNGRGFPNGLRGKAIPQAMRIALLTYEFEILARVEGVPAALALIRRRRGRGYDPDLTDILLAHGDEWWAALESADPWDAALALAPGRVPLDAARLREALLVLADFADLQSPWTAGHSRSVAALAGQAAGPAAEAAALVHDLGRVGVPNTIWDKPGPLTRDERDRAESHALLTDQLLRRVPALAGLADAAAGAHERLDGSGYCRRLRGGQLDDVQRVLAAADCYAAMTADRPHRAALTPAAAATDLRAMSADGRLDPGAVERVLAAAGHPGNPRPAHRSGLTAREIEVLRLLAHGLKTREIADRLVISPKTADHHIQHIYTKINASTRGAATLFAIENGILE